MGLWKDKERGHWRFSFQYNGKTFTGRGFSTKAEARTAREEKRKNVAEKSNLSMQIPNNFRYIASLYLDDAKRRFSEKTYKYKAYVYRSFIKFNGDIDIKKITPNDLHSYLNTRSSNYNYNAHRKELSALFTFARQRLKIISFNPIWDIDKQPHTPKPKTIPSENEILKLIMAANPKTDERDLLLTILHTAGRIDEILRLTWHDINFERLTLTRWTRKRKGGSYEPITGPMNKDLYEILLKRWYNRKNHKWVFFNEKTITRFSHRPKFMKGLCKRSGINPPFGFHALRHFTASLLADNKKISTKTISKILGHKNTSTTEIYLHSIDESQRLALESLEGKFNIIENKISVMKGGADTGAI